MRKFELVELVDTHCHIHFPDYELVPDEVIRNANNVGVKRLICVGCTLSDSQLAIDMAERHSNVWASIGLHPHEAKDYVNDPLALQKFRELAVRPKVVAVGEIGLDYYYNHSPREDQKQLLRFQLDIAVEHHLPLIFHVRNPKSDDLSAVGEAFKDFWEIFDDYKNLEGVIHSFSSGLVNLEQILERGLYVGLNGIMTFTKNNDQLTAVKQLPLNRLVLETDSPFLTPVPFRGKICQPSYVLETAKFLSELRGENLETFAEITTQNAITLFRL